MLRSSSEPTRLAHLGALVLALVSGGAWGYGTVWLVVDMKNMNTWDIEPPGAFANGVMFLGFVVAMVLGGGFGYTLGWMVRWGIGRSLLAVEIGLAAASVLAIAFAMNS